MPVIPEAGKNGFEQKSARQRIHNRNLDGNDVWISTSMLAPEVSRRSREDKAIQQVIDESVNADCQWTQMCVIARERNGESGAIRTLAFRLRRPALYPAELHSQVPQFGN